VVAAGALRPRISVATPVTLSLWSASEMEPFTPKLGASRTHRGFRSDPSVARNVR
jgi:hypothetical protein